MPHNDPTRIYLGLALALLGCGGLLGLAVVAEAMIQPPANLSVESWHVFAGGLRARIGVGFSAAAGLVALTTVLAWSGRRASALVPGVLLYLIPAVVIEIARGGPVGWLVQTEPLGLWSVPTVLVEGGLLFGPALVLMRFRVGMVPLRQLSVALGLIGTPAITAVWLLAAFTAPTGDGVVLMCVTAIAVLAAGILADASSTPTLAITAVGTALTIRAVDLGSSWPVAATMCLAAGVIAAGVAPQLWARRHEPLFATRTASG